MSTESAATALFASCLQPSELPTCDQAWAAIRDSLRRHGGVRGCTAVCAVEYGDHPDTARARMSWALELVAQFRRLAPMAA
jgi:hypothetical protein